MISFEWMGAVAISDGINQHEAVSIPYVLVPHLPKHVLKQLSDILTK